MRNLLITAAIVGVCMVSLGIVTQQEARDCLQWDLYIVVSCAFGIGTAIENAGVAADLATFFVKVGTSMGIGDAGVYGAVFLGTSLLSSILTNNAAAALMYPIAMDAWNTPRAESTDHQQMIRNVKGLLNWEHRNRYCGCNSDPDPENKTNVAVLDRIQKPSFTRSAIEAGFMQLSMKPSCLLIVLSISYSSNFNEGQTFIVDHLSEVITMAISFAILGIFLMLDISFIVNFFFVRALRKWTNRRAKDTERASKKTKEVVYKESDFETFLFGWVLGKVKADPLSSQRFPNWMPIPWYLGVTSTSALVLISLAFLSPAFLFKQFGLSMPGGGLNTDLCDAEAQAQSLAELNATLKEMMNFDDAMEQFNIMWGITPAMQSDVALYGTPGFRCKASPPIRSTGTDTYSLDGTLEQWTDPDKRFKYPAAKWGTYFPGYCRAFYDSEIKLKQLQVCGPREICKCPTLPNTSPFTWIGLGGKEVCSMKVCFTFDNIPCGQVADFSNYKDLFPPNNYRAQQLKFAREQQDLQMKEQNFPNSATGISTKAVETFTTILRQIDLGSNIYSVYACLSLYFPSAIDVFREPYSNAAKRVLFGTEKFAFIIGVIAVWWAYDYIGRLLHNPDIQVLLANIRVGNPCYLDGKYVIERQKLLGDLCNIILPTEQNFTIVSGTATSIIDEVEYMASSSSAQPKGCDCKYPMKALQAFGTAYYPQSLMSKFGFNRTVVTMDNVFLPFPGVEFKGNTSVCQDSDLARRIILQAPVSEFQGPDLWLQSGLVSALVIKIVVANFVISLLRVADPFVVCNGEFTWIPAKFGLGVDAHDKSKLFASFKVTKEASLWYINFRDLLWWGLIMHLALWNLMSAAYTKSLESGVTSDDIAVMRLALTVAGVVAVLGLTATVCLRVKKRRATKKAATKT